MNQVYTVSQVNGYLKELLEEDVQMTSIFVKGEVSNFVHHMKTGHFYFTLKNGKAAIKCIMFKWNAQHLRFLPGNGQNVIVFGSVQLFERDGICQINCADMQPDGIGALYLAFEQLKEKLSRQGLFDPAHKRPLPALPRRIGVVTSKNGAALQDICNILSRRYPLGELVLIPALVQGESAPISICDGITRAQNANLDLLIVGRGGGSIEDLWAFNDERVAYAIYQSKIPVISAVGHETDYTIADFVADLRAPTPSAAAELAAPDISGLRAALSEMQKNLARCVSHRIVDGGSRLDMLAERFRAVSPDKTLATAEKRLEELRQRLANRGKQLLEQPEAGLHRLETALEALSPLQVLRRGYTIAFAGKQVLSSVSQAEVGALISVKLTDGFVEAQITAVRPDKPPEGMHR